MVCFFRMHHHALLLVGDYEACLAEIPEADRTGADAERIVTDTLGIDEARALSVRAASRPVEHTKRTFIIACAQITTEAQNALLKTFEDPPKTAQFYLIVPRLSVLLPTLRSRLQLAFASEDAAMSDTVKKFLRASYADRLEQIAALHKAKDAAGMRALIEDVERTVAAAPSPKKAAYLEDVALVSQYAEIRGASHKMLLEHLALSVPSPFASR